MNKRRARKQVELFQETENIWPRLSESTRGQVLSYVSVLLLSGLRGDEPSSSEKEQKEVIHVRENNPIAS